MMSQSLKHSALAWALILTQFALSVFGHGGIVICHDNDGPSHIELVRCTTSSGDTADTCGQSRVNQNDAEVGLCTGSLCVDEVISFTSTLNARRGMANKSIIDFLPTAPPSILLSLLPLDSTELTRQGTELEDACYLKKLHCALRTTVMVI